MTSSSPPAPRTPRRMRRRALAVLSIYLALALSFGVLHGLHVLR